MPVKDYVVFVALNKNSDKILGTSALVGPHFTRENFIHKPLAILVSGK